MRLVLDTSVLIDHLRGRPKAATEIIPRAIARGDELWSSYVVRAELLAGMRALADLIIVALAQHLDGELKTTNVKHFPMFKGLKAAY